MRNEELPTLRTGSAGSAGSGTRPWDARECFDVLNMSYAAFAAKYPDRSKGSYCGKRSRLREQLAGGRDPVVAEIAHDAEKIVTAVEIEEAGEAVEAGEAGEEAAELLGAAHSSRSRKHKPMISWQDFEIEEETDDEALMEALVSYQRQRNKVFASKLVHEVRIEVPDGGPIAVAFPSDWHIGNVGTDHERIVRDVQLIAEHPRLFCALGGDPVDNFIIEKMISASRSQIAQVDVQWRLFRHLVKKLVKSQSLLFVGAGNHDAWTQKVAGLDGISAALRGIAVVNTGEGGFVKLTVGAVPYMIYRKHKPTRWNSSYNPTHFLKQMLRMGATYDFDIGVSEHFHNANIELGEYRPGTGGERAFITTGSYKVRDQYSEDLGFYGGGYGVPVVVLWPDRKEIMPVMRLTQAITILDAFAPAQPVA